MEQQLQPLFKAKYNWDISTDSDSIIEITPTKLIAWGKYGQGCWRGTEVLHIWRFVSK